MRQPLAIFKYFSRFVFCSVFIFLPFQERDGVPFFSNQCIPHWEVFASPNVPEMHNSLRDIFVISADDIWATGTYFPFSSSTQTTQEFESLFAAPATLTNTEYDRGGLLLHWNGTAWSIIDQTYGRDLNEIYGDASNDVWISATNPNLDDQYFLHWDGQTLQRYPVIETDIFLDGTSATDIWSITNPASALHWDGQNWNAVKGTTDYPNTMYLNALKVFAPNDVWAAGGEYVNSVFTFPLLVRWDGAEWIFQSAPAVNPAFLRALDGTSSSDMWVASSFYQNTLASDVIFHWNSHKWQAIRGPKPSRGKVRYYGFKAMASDDVWTVGSFARFGAEGGQMLLGHWDGKRWSVILEPNLALSRSSLVDIDAVSSEELWAVGSQWVDGEMQTLVVHGTRPCYLPPAPRLRLPKDKTSVSETNITLDWKGSPTATYFKLQVRPDNHTTKPIVRTRTENSEYRIEDLLPDTKYLWRVRGCNGGGCGKWSHYRSFHVLPK